MVDNDEDSDETIEPLIDQLASAFDSANSGLNGLQRRGLITRQADEDEVAQMTADIINVSPPSWHRSPFRLT
jgi:hypothetical protein